MNTNGEVAGDLFHLHVYLQQIIFLQLLFAYRWVNAIKTFCRGGGGESLRKKSNLRSTNPSLEQVHIGCTVLCVCAATAGRHTDACMRKTATLQEERDVIGFFLFLKETRSLSWTFFY